MSLRSCYSNLTVTIAKTLTKCLCTAICTGPSSVARCLLQRPSALASLTFSLTACFQYDPTKSALFLTAAGQGNVGAAPRIPLSLPSSHQQHETASKGAAGGGEGGGGSSRSTAAEPSLPAAASQPVTCLELSAPSVPSMPPLLLLLGSVRAYEAVALVARTLGHCARLTAAGQGTMGKQWFRFYLTWGGRERGLEARGGVS